MKEYYFRHVKGANDKHVADDFGSPPKRKHSESESPADKRAKVDEEKETQSEQTEVRNTQ